MTAQNPGKYWFARPDWGFGPYPVTAAGWATSIMLMVGFFAILIVAFRLKNMAVDPSWLWLVVLAAAPLEAYVATRLVRAKTDPVRRISDYRAARGSR